MLIATAKINESSSSDDGLDARNTLRPSFNFGEDLFFQEQ